MILSGEKTEEYREGKSYWITRLTVLNNDIFEDFGTTQVMQWLSDHYEDFLEFDTIKFTNGYSKNAPTFTIECLGITIGKAKPEWSDNWQGDVFIIKLGKIIDK